MSIQKFQMSDEEIASLMEGPKNSISQKPAHVEQRQVWFALKAHEMKANEVIQVTSEHKKNYGYIRMKLSRLSAATGAVFATKQKDGLLLIVCYKAPDLSRLVDGATAEVPAEALKPFPVIPAPAVWVAEPPKRPEPETHPTREELYGWLNSWTDQTEYDYKPIEGATGCEQVSNWVNELDEFEAYVSEDGTYVHIEKLS